MNTSIICKTKIDRTVAGLKKIADDFLLEAYGINLNIPIEINARLTSTYGMYYMNDDGSPKKIAIAKRVVTYGHDKSLLNTLKHECIHYAMDMLGRNSNDYHPEFEAELEKQGAGRNCEIIDVGEIFIYGCSCGKLYKMNRKIKNLNEYSCQCNKPLSLKIVYIMDGFNIISKREVI